MLQQSPLVSGLTQRDLAHRIETDQKDIWALESGKNTIILERIFAIMRETGVRMYMEIHDSLDESLHDVEEPND
jgi:HTH-type transcriptional regulator/antitoxin HipB